MAWIPLVGEKLVKLGCLRGQGLVRPEIPVETTVPMTKKCNEWSGYPAWLDVHMDSSMTAMHFHRAIRTSRVAALGWAVVVLGLCCAELARAGDSDVIIKPIQFAELMDEPAAEVLTIPGSPLGEVLVDGPTADYSVLERPIVDISSRAADGMRVEDFTLDEMPHEASSGDWFSSGRWYGSAEVLWFDRSRNYRQQIGVEVSPAAPGVVVEELYTDSVPFDLSAGTRLTLGQHIGRDYLDRDQNLEFIFYGAMSWYAKDAWNAREGLVIISPLDPNAPGFNGASAYETTRSTTFNSMEWNYKLNRRLGRDQLVMGPNGNWSRHAERAWLPGLILGTRVVNVNDSFMLTSSGNGRSGTYDIDAQNWLWGLNIGGELISQNEFFFWGLRGRATPAMNFAASQQTAEGSAPDEDPLDLAGSGDQFAAGFIGDLSLFAGWQVTPNFALKAGYDFLWVAGIATATRQFNLDNVKDDPIDPGGQAFFNGVSIGCEGSW